LECSGSSNAYINFQGRKTSGLSEVARIVDWPNGFPLQFRDG
jgi:hypothetical protein